MLKQRRLCVYVVRSIRLWVKNAPLESQTPVLKAYTFRCGRPLGIFWEILHLTHNPQRMFRNSESAFNLSNS